MGITGIYSIYFALGITQETMYLPPDLESKLPIRTITLASSKTLTSPNRNYSSPPSQPSSSLPSSTSSTTPSRNGTASLGYMGSSAEPQSPCPPYPTPTQSNTLISQL